MEFNPDDSNMDFLKKVPQSKETAMAEYDRLSSTFKETSEEEQPLMEAQSSVSDFFPEEEKEPFSIKFKRFIFRLPEFKARTVCLNRETPGKFPANKIRNQKYNPITFLPVILFEQFRFFFNLYFLLVALSQFIPILQVGFLFTYVSPLAFVLAVTILKEAWDDFKRWQRDKEANSQKYQKLTSAGLVEIPSSDIKVGDIIYVHINQRIPADMVFIRTTEKNGACFIRTDQLDGETDWKLRRAVNYTQSLPSDNHLLHLRSSIYAEKPKKDIYNFIGNFFVNDSGTHGSSNVESLSVDNTVWANTVVASGTLIGIVVYTGAETRSVMNTSAPKTKVGLLDLEVNRLAKILCGLLLLLSFLMIVLNPKRFQGLWYIYFFRFMLLFSAIIPISLRVNLDMAKTAYSFFIMRDKKIPSTIVRSSTIPEELGRIEYLLSDKTGTLTQNDMVFKKLHLGSVSFSKDTLDEIQGHLENGFTDRNKREKDTQASSHKIRRTITTRVLEALKSISLCHNVTPVVDSETNMMNYQASSPDEIALVKFAESVNLRLVDRDIDKITLKTPLDELEDFEVLNIFPFTSETKRMGIIVREKETGTITFYMKGADVVMSKIVGYNDWLDEECGNMAREGLRTLVFGKKNLSEDEYKAFAKRLNQAKTSVKDRDQNVRKAVESIEAELELLCLTGVEDKLQDNVKETLEMLAPSGIKVWMLTGDKMETAKCIAISTRLVSRSQNIFPFSVKSAIEAEQQLHNFSNLKDTCLLIDGTSLQFCIDNFPEKFIEIACVAPSVVCCRCSPTQKAEIVKLIKLYKKACTCAIGDGGNDVSMIQAADVGIGIVGKEGKQASLAADFSITQFSFISRLLLWHGRNSYTRSARLSQFIIHRGLIISFIQAVFSCIFYFAAIAIYNGWLLVGYATAFTTAPVFCLILDEDLSDSVVFKFPELYKELQKGRALSNKTFFIWVFTSVYQGGIIMLMSLVLFTDNLINIVSITFTALILTELLNVAFEIHSWNRYIFLSEMITIVIYLVSMVVLKTYFDIVYIASWDFLWKVTVVTSLSCVPLYLARLIKRKLDPPSYSKLS